MKALSLITSILVLVVLMAAPPGFGQASYSTATLKGTVLDAQGASVPGATVTVTNPSTGLRKTVKTGSDGAYQFAELAPGTYQVEGEAPGFEKVVAKGVVLTVGQIVVYDVHLKVGSPSTVVEVTENAVPLIEPQQTQQANTVNERQVANLPNITRNFTQSIYTLPGIVNALAVAAQDPGVVTGYLNSGFSVGGSNGRNNLITIDGGENDYGSGALRFVHVPIDSVQEFQVNRNSSAAEFGFTVGTAMNMITKSGTNKYHGSASIFFHDQATDAANFFNGFSANPASKPFEQSVISGGTFGGPIKKDKLFFFTSYEYQKLDSNRVVNLLGTTEFQPLSAQTNGYNPGTKKCPNQPQQVTQLCYLTQLANSGSAAAGLGALFLKSTIFSPLGDPKNSIGAEAILNALVAADNGTFDGNAAASASVVQAEPYENGRFHNWVTRLDYLPGEKDTLTVRFGFQRESYDVIGAGGVRRMSSNNLLRRDYTPMGAWTHLFGPHVVNVLRVQGAYDQAPAHTPQASGSEINLSAGGGINLGRPFAYPYDITQKRLQVDDSVSWIKGTHSFKFGGSYRPVNYGGLEELWFGGQFTFLEGAIPIIGLFPSAPNSCGIGVTCQQAVAGFNISQGYGPSGPVTTNLTAAQSFVAGLPLVFLGANGNGQFSEWAHYLGLYAQDSWRISRKLTMNYGVRLDYDAEPSPVPHSVYGSPRLGIAWDRQGNQKTVIRAGGGVFVAPSPFIVPFYTQILGPNPGHINQGGLINDPRIFALWAANHATATPANPNPAVTAAQLATAGVSIVPPGPGASGSVFFTVGQNFKPQYSIQASLSIAREIAPNLSVEVAYQMYRSVHIEQDQEVNFVRNAAIPIDPFVGPFYMPKPGTTNGEPNAQILQNNAYSSIGSSIYHGMTASLTKRYSHGLQFQANYTFSRAIDNTSDFSSLSIPFRPDLLNLDRAVSFFNITHNFAVNAVYTTPFHPGGSLLSRVLADIDVSPIVYARSGIPFTLLVPGLRSNGAGHQANARPFHEPRNTGIGPNFISWDMRISKAIYIRRDSGLRLDVIAQGTNLLNRTNFSVVNNIFPADPNFALPNGGNLLNGPYRVSGFVPKSAADLSKPLAFSQANTARQLSFALKLAF